MFLFEKRLDCLSDDNTEAEELINAVKDMFLASEEMMTMPIWMAKLFIRKTFWKHDAAWNVITRIGTTNMNNDISK